MARRLLLAMLAVGVVVRVILLRAPDTWYDEATNGLMGLAVLRGELPLYFYGQAFMGALDAYLAAPFYFLFGPSVHTLKLLPLALTLLWMALTVGLAAVAFGQPAAAFAAALLAVPPDFLLSWTIEVRTKYHLCVVLGTLALLLALRPPGRVPTRDIMRLGVLGLVLGLAFWTNFLTVVFVPAVAILIALRSGLLRALPGLPVAAATFALGSVPHWVYGISHGTAVPHTGGWVGWATFAAHVGALGRVAWPAMAGVPIALQNTRLGFTIALAAALVSGFAGVIAVRSAVGGGGPGRAMALALVVLIVVNFGTAVGTRHGDRIDNDPKYFLPVYTALPALLGAGLATLPSRAAAVVLLGLLALQASSVATGTLQSQRAYEVARLAADRREFAETITAVEQAGPTRFYARDPGPSMLAFLSDERVIVSDPYLESYPAYARAVDGARRVGWWFRGRNEPFEAHLAALGVQATYHRFGPQGGAYVDFTLPPDRLRELDPRVLRVTASVSADEAPSMLDREAGTYWSSGQAQHGGEWIQVDLGRIEPVALVRWLPRIYQDVPVGLRLESSLDGVRWQHLLELPNYEGPFYWSAGRPLERVRSGRVELRVKPTPARYLRITQTGQELFWHWTVRELFVYAADASAPPTASDADGPPLARAVRAAGVRRLYADHGWSNRLAFADPDLRVPPANLPLDAYNFTGPEAELFPLVEWQPGAGALVEPPDVPGFIRTASASGLGIERRDLGGLTLFVYAPPPHASSQPIPSAELRVTASVAPHRAGRVIDGSRHTRWTTGRPRAAGDWLRVDLASPRQVTAVRMATESSDESPRALRLEASADGATWAALPAQVRTEGRVRWGGITWLRDDTTAVWLEVPPVTARALRVSLTSGDSDHPWSIHKLSVHADD